MTCVKVIVDTDRAAIDSGIHRHNFEFTWITHRAGAKSGFFTYPLARRGRQYLLGRQRGG